MIKKLINFTEPEDKIIHKQMELTGLSYSEIVRRAIDEYFSHYLKKENKP